MAELVAKYGNQNCHGGAIARPTFKGDTGFQERRGCAVWMNPKTFIPEPLAISCITRLLSAAKRLNARL